MASSVKYECFARDLGLGVHNLDTGVLKIALTNTAPNAGTHEVLADITELGAGSGYAAGGTDAQGAFSEAGGVGTLTGTDVVFTASGGSIGPFRYAVLYNDTPSSPANPLIGYWDYASSITLLNGETFTVDFSASILTIT